MHEEADVKKVRLKEKSRGYPERAGVLLRFPRRTICTLYKMIYSGYTLYSHFFGCDQVEVNRAQNL